MEGLYLEAVAWRCSVKKVFLEISQNSQENTPARVSETSACNFIKKETMTQVFPCEICEISMNTFSYRAPVVAASRYPARQSRVIIPKCLYNQGY